MPFRLGPIAPVLLGVVSAQVALGIMTALIPLLLLQVGVSAPAIGYVASAYFLGFLAGALTANRVVRRVGHIRAFAVFAALCADAALLLVFARDAWEVALLRGVIGYNSSGMFLVAESWLNDRADASTRGRAWGAYLVASWGGAAAGPLALSAVDASPEMFVLVGMAFATALLPMALTHRVNPEVGSQIHFGLVRLFRTSPVGVVCCLSSGLVNSAFYGLVPVYLERHGFGSGEVAGFLSAATVAGLLVQYPVGMLSDRVGRRPVTLGVLVVGLGAALTMQFIGALPYVVVASIGALLAAMTAPLYGLAAGQTNDRIEGRDYVAASGGLLFIWSLGSSVGPGAAGALMGRAGPAGLFAYIAAVLAAAGLFTFARMLLRGEVPREQRSVFVPAPSAPARLPELASGAVTAQETRGEDVPEPIR
jgi:MFS family permease